MYRFCLGLGKKVLIANTLGSFVDDVYGNDEIVGIAAEQVGFARAWLVAICYTFQLYFDFSGYSDMAIGLGKMMGFRFPENFNNPYISQSITEFWRRWHITLGNWMRNYLYIPLGGNKVDSRARLYFNLWIVFLLSGLWHGASWSFVIVIGDSFFWPVYNKTWENEFFKYIEFRYYNREIDRSDKDKGLLPCAENWREKLKQFDVVLFLVSEANLSKFPWGFTDQVLTSLQTSFEPGSRRELLDKIEFNVRNDARFMRELSDRATFQDLDFDTVVNKEVKVLLEEID